MLLWFIVLTFSKTPIVLMPGLYGSNIQVSYSKSASKFWFCPRHMNHSLLWLNYNLLLPPFMDCFFELLKGYYDPTTDTIGNPPYHDIDVYDFGGVEGIMYADKDGFLGKNNYISLAKLIEKLKNYGYIVKKDLFGAPFDWRIAPVGIENSFFPKLKKLIEHASESNQNQKVTFIAYSMGSLMAQRFLSQFVSQEWKDRYINKLIFLAPALAGSGISINAMWTKKFSLMYNIESETIHEAIESSPCLHALMPNHVAFGESELVRTPDGKSITAKELPGFFIEKGKISGNNIKMMAKSEAITSKRLNEVNVPVYILYNSGIGTPHSLDFSNGYDKQPVTKMAPGDDTVPSQGIEWICNNWKMNFPLVCHDFQSSNGAFSHGELSNNPYVQELVYNMTISDHWISEKGSKTIYSPYVEIDDLKETFEIKESMKPQREIINH